MDKLDLKKTSLLALLLSFEKYWIPHFITEGELYFLEIKETARNIIVLFEDIYEVDDNALTTSPVSDMRNHFIRPFKDWLGMVVPL